RRLRASRARTDRGPDPAGARRCAGGAAHRAPPGRGLCAAASWQRRCNRRRSGSTVNEALRMISSMATRELLAQLAARYMREHGVAVEAGAGGGVEVARRISAGEAFDVVVLASNAIDKLIAEGRVTGARMDLVRSGVAIAVRAGAPQPAVATEEDVKAAVRAAS